MADAVEASIEDGVLETRCPKANQAKPKRIQLRPGGGREAIEATRVPADHPELLAEQN